LKNVEAVTDASESKRGANLSQKSITNTSLSQVQFYYNVRIKKLTRIKLR